MGQQIVCDIAIIKKREIIYRKIHHKIIKIGIQASSRKGGYYKNGQTKFTCSVNGNEVKM